MYGKESLNSKRWNAGYFILIVSLMILALTTRSLATTPAPVVAAVSNQGNRLLDNGTIIFGADVDVDWYAFSYGDYSSWRSSVVAVDVDADGYALGNEDYSWKSIGGQAAMWVREGVIRSVPPSDVIALFKEYFMAENQDLMVTLKKVLVVEMPVIITSFMLITMAVFIPIVGVVFCCCRCAGKCGGTRREEDIAALSTFSGLVAAVALLAVCTFIGTASYLTNPSVIRMVDTIDHTSTVAKNVLHDVETFKDNFVQDLERLGVDDLGFVLDAVDSKLDDIGAEVSVPLLVDTEPYLRYISASLDVLAEELNSLTDTGSVLDNVISMSSNLVSSGQSLKEALTTAKNNLTAIRDDCLADTARVTAGACDVIPDPADLDGGELDFDTLTVGDLDLGDLSNETKTALTNIRNLLATGNTTLQGVSELIGNASAPSLDGIRDVINELQEMVEGLVNDTTASLDDLFESLDFESLEDSIDSKLQLPVEDNTVTIVSSLLPLVCALMVVFTVVGLSLAPCGSSCRGGPARRGCPSDCGGKMLMGSACWSFSISLIVCLLGALFLILGSTLTIICDSLLDLSIITEIVDDPNMWGGNHLTSRLSFGNSTFNLTVYQILEDCKEDETLFTALDLKSTGLLDMVLELNLREMLPDITDVYDSVNDTVSSLDVMPSGEADSFLDELTGQLSPQNISDAIGEMQLGLDDISLSNVSDTLYAGADTVEGAYPAMAADLRDMADDVVFIEQQNMEGTKNLMIALRAEVTRLNETLHNVEIASEVVSVSVSGLSDFIKIDAGSVIIESLEAYIESILALADQFISEVLRRIRDDMGKCGIIRNIYDGIVGAVCLFFLPGLNVFWFALAAISFALVPNIIFNVRLAKYLRRPTHPAPPGRGGLEGVAVYPPSDGSAGGSRGVGQRIIDRVSDSFVNITIPRSMMDHFNRSH